MRLPYSSYTLRVYKFSRKDRSEDFADFNKNVRGQQPFGTCMQAILNIILKMLMDKNLPCTVLRFLYSWYKDQELAVRCIYLLISQKPSESQMVYARAVFSGLH